MCWFPPPVKNLFLYTTSHSHTLYTTKVREKFPSIPVSHMLDSFSLPCSLDAFSRLQELHLSAAVGRLTMAWYVNRFMAYLFAFNQTRFLIETVPLLHRSTDTHECLLLSISDLIHLFILFIYPCACVPSLSYNEQGSDAR